MDDLEDDEDLGASAAAKPVVYRGPNWRPKIAKRVLERVRLILGWLRVTFLPKYGLRAFICMILITCGRLADAASFVVGTHILTRSLTHGDGALSGIQGGLTLAAAGMAGVLAGGSFLSYIGNKIAVKLIMEYENSCVVQGLVIARSFQDAGSPLPKGEISNLTRQAPRMMSRSLLHIIHACTSVVMLFTGLATCVVTFPVLTLIVMLSLALLSPIYVYAAVHSTNIGHHVRSASPAYSGSMNRFQNRWLSAEDFDPGQILRELRANVDYNEFQSASSARLNLSGRNHLISNLTLAFVIGVSFLWIGSNVDLNSGTIPKLVSYLVALRLFAHGLGGLFHGVQSINTTLPYFLNFLIRDTRLGTPSEAGR